MKYIHSKNYDKTRLLEVLSLDDVVYDKKYTGTFESVSKRYQSNEEMFIFAVNDDNKMCGYICFFPISDSVTIKIENEPFMFDDNINHVDVLQYNKNTINNIFLISVAVSPEYRGEGIGFNLVKEMFAFLNSLSNIGYEIGKLFASTTSIDGEKLLSKFNFQKAKKYDNNNSLMKYEFICYKNIDLYLFFPVQVTKTFLKKDTNSKFLEKLVETSILEVNSLMNERLERYFIGKIKFAPEDDYGNMMSTKVLDANIYLSAYRDIGVLIVEFPSISFDPTYVLNQSSGSNLKITNESDEQLFMDYLVSLGLSVLGNCTHLLVSGKKLSSYYRQFVLYSEAYFNRIGSRIISKEAEMDATTNFAQYEFGDIYCSSVGVSFEFNPQTPSNSYHNRLQTSILMIFINEILALEIASLKLVQNVITKEFDNSPKPSIEIIENLIDSFGKYIVLFEYNCKYPLAKCLSDKVSARFGIAEMQKDYRNNIDQLNTIVSIRSERLNKEFSQKQETLFKVISVFTLLISINSVISLFAGKDFSKKQDLIPFIISLCIWGGAVIYLVAIWVKRIYKRKK